MVTNYNTMIRDGKRIQVLIHVQNTTVPPQYTTVPPPNTPIPPQHVSVPLHPTTKLNKLMI